MRGARGRASGGVLTAHRLVFAGVDQQLHGLVEALGRALLQVATVGVLLERDEAGHEKGVSKLRPLCRPLRWLRSGETPKGGERKTDGARPKCFRYTSSSRGRLCRCLLLDGGSAPLASHSLAALDKTRALSLPLHKKRATVRRGERGRPLFSFLFLRLSPSLPFLPLPSPSPAPFPSTARTRRTPLTAMM